MTNFLKKITDANFLPGKKSRGNNHYVYSSIFNSLMDKLIPIVTAEKEVTVEKLKFEESDSITIASGAGYTTKRSGTIITSGFTVPPGGIDSFRIYLAKDLELTEFITLPDSAMLFLQLEAYSGTGLPMVYSVDSQTSRFTVTIKNIATSGDLSAPITLKYFIINV